MMALSMQLLMRALTAMVLTVACMVFTSSAHAQTDRPAPPGPSEQTPNISDQKLDAAAAALERVVSLQEDYKRRLQGAPTSDMERIADEAKGEFVKAITDQGLSVEEYNSIIVVARNDPEVRKKILQRMRPPAQ
jgi:hypothetical protein